MVINTALSDRSCGLGIYHIHSDFSYDGNNSLREIAAWGKSLGLDFVLLTEHDLGFDQGKFEEFCNQCERNSGDVLLVPGIEYEVIHGGSKIHIGAIGVPVLIDKEIVYQGLEALVDAIRGHGGLAVLHHPDNIKKVLNRQIVETFDLIEIWNTKFDCGFGPNFLFLRWLQGQLCPGGYLVSADIHDVSRFRKDNAAFIDLEVSAQAVQVTTIIDCLRQGRYLCRIGSWRVFPNGIYEVPNRLYRLLPFVLSVEKKTLPVCQVLHTKKL